MAEEKEVGSSLKKNLAIGATGVVLTAAVAGVAGAILANKNLRKTLGKKAVKALETVSQLASKAEKQAEAGLKLLQKNGDEKRQKAAPKKTGSTKKV